MSVVNQLPRDYILCEGASDAQFLCLYIENLFDYEYDSTLSRSYSSSIENSSFYYLKGNNRDLLVISCGGCCNISTLLDEIVRPSMKVNENPARIIAVLDRDLKTDKECLRLLSCTDFIFSIGEWVDGKINGNFIMPDGKYNEILWRTYLAIIPTGSPGSFENVLIDSINSDNPEIVTEVSAFYDGLSKEAKKHIASPRKEIKARLDTMLLLINPEKLFESLKSLFSEIELEEENIKKNYGFLSEVCNPM